MGNCFETTLHFVENGQIPGQNSKITAIAEEFCMTKKDLDLMFSAFSKFDPKRLQDLHGKQQAGYVNVEDFFVLNQITNASFAAHMSETLFFSNKTGYINFEEFLVIVWHLITLREKQLSAFAFKLFDSDDDLCMRSDELMEMFTVICGPSDQSFKKLRDAFSSVGLTKISCTLEQFTTIIESNASLLFPVFEMQLLLRDRTIGSRFLHLQDIKMKKWGHDKKLDEILETFQVKPDCYLHRDDFKKVSGSGKKGGKQKKATEVEKPVEDIQFHKPKKMHNEARRKSSVVGNSPTGDTTDGHKKHRKSIDQADSPKKTNADHHNVGGGWEVAANDTAPVNPNTKHTKDYIAKHRTGHELHDATEHNQLIAESPKFADKFEEDRKKTKHPADGEQKKEEHKFHVSSHHSNHKESGGGGLSPNKSGKGEKTNKVAIEEGWHASV